MDVNEATFEARLDATLRALFPGFASLRITHQTTLVLQLGHRTVVIDGKPREDATGRLDVLVEIESKPVMLLELKKPGIALLEEDRKQAMSYARLLERMPPLFAVSNGVDTKIYTTHDAQPFETGTVDEAAVERVVSEALVAAAEDRDAAVRDILGRRPDLWAQIASAETNTALAAITGRPSAFTHPLCSTFSIERTSVQQVLSLVEADEKIVAVVGPMMSGKTNVLAQFCRRAQQGLPLLFVDASALSHGIWQHIANVLTHRMLLHASSQDARDWLASGLNDPGAPKFVVVIDGLKPEESETLRASVDELVQMSERSSLRLVLSLDEDQLKGFSSNAGRPTKTPFGRLVKSVPLTPLSDDEFDAAHELLRREHHFGFPDGAGHNFELREARVLRLNLALFESAPAQQFDADDVANGPSFLTAFVLDWIWKEFAPDPDVKALLKQLALAFVEGAWSASVGPQFGFDAHRKAAIPMEVARSRLGDTSLLRLRVLGFVTATQGDLLLMRVPELLAAAGASVIASRIGDDVDTDQAYVRLIRESQRLPYGEVAAALALVAVSRSDLSRFDDLIRRLAADPPQESLDSEAGVVSVTEVAEKNALLLGPAIRNLHPWLVVSHAAHFEVDLPEWHEALFARVGNSKFEIRRIETVPVGQIAPPERMLSVRVHRLPTGDEVLCHHNGIIEPLTHAMLQHMVRAPDAMVKLAKAAIETEQYFLVWRLLLMAFNATDIALPLIAERARWILNACVTYWGVRFQGVGLH